MYVYRLDGPAENRATGQTACNWEQFTLTPGVYPIEFTTIGGDPVKVGEHPYYARIVVPAVRTETYCVSRIFQHSSVEHRTGLNEATTRTLSLYAYQVEAGRFLHGGIIEIADHHEEQS